MWAAEHGISGIGSNHWQEPSTESIVADSTIATLSIADTTIEISTDSTRDDSTDVTLDDDSNNSVVDDESPDSTVETDTIGP